MGQRRFVHGAGGEIRRATGAVRAGWQDERLVPPFLFSFCTVDEILSSTERKVSAFHLFADLELGHVLLFPIDDKQSRPSGQDQVSRGDEREEVVVYVEASVTLT